MHSCSWTLWLVTILAGAMVFTGTAPAYAAVWKSFFAVFLVGSLLSLVKEWRQGCRH